VFDVMAAIRVLVEKRGIDAVNLVLSGEEEHVLTALYAALLSQIDHVRLKNLLKSFASLLQQESHNWGTVVFVHGLLEHIDIDVLLDAFPQGNVQINGIVDHMKERIVG
jgi:hypothetical protein